MAPIGLAYRRDNRSATVRNFVALPRKRARAFRAKTDVTLAVGWTTVALRDPAGCCVTADIDVDTVLRHVPPARSRRNTHRAGDRVSHHHRAFCDVDDDRIFPQIAPIERLARIDGYSRLAAFVGLVLPLARSGIAVAAVITFLFAWNEYTYALVLVNGSTANTLPTAISGGSGANFWFELDRTYALRIDYAVSTAFQIAGAVLACFGNLTRLNWFLRMRWSSSMPAMVTLARLNLLKPSIGPILAFTPRWSCSMMLLRYFEDLRLVSFQSVARQSG